MASKYVRDLERAEIKKFDREMTRRRLQKVLDENKTAAAVRKYYKLTKEESEILDELEVEQERQKQLDGAFLKGFQQKGEF